MPRKKAARFGRLQAVNKAHKREKNQPIEENWLVFSLSSSAATANGGHLRLCTLPFLQSCFLDLQAFLPA